MTASICIALLGALSGLVPNTRAQTVLDVDATDYGNSPYTVAATVSYVQIEDGIDSTGEIDQSGFTISSGKAYSSSYYNLLIGVNSGSTGVYKLSGGTLSTINSTSELIGVSGTGTFTLSGTGVNTVTGAVILGFNAGATGTYTLSGGTLNTSIVEAGVAAGGTGGTSTFNFNGGTLQASAASTTFMTGLTSAKVQAGGAIINNGGFAITIGQALIHDSALGGTADGGLSLSGTGTLTLTATNTYTGGTTINAGVLALGSAGAIGTTGTILFKGGTLQFSAANTTDYSNRFGTTMSQALNIDTNGQAVTFGSKFAPSSGGTLTKLGSGTLALNSSSNSYTGTTTISTGTLALGIGNSTGTLPTGSAIVDNATFAINRSNAVTQGTDFSTAAITGTGGFTQAGTGTTTLSAANTYSGVTTISAGKLTLTNALAVQNSTVTNSVTNGVVFDSSVSGNAFTFGGLAGSTNLVLANNAATPAAVALTVGNNSTAATYSGVLSGAGSLVKTGTGTQTLTGANTYTGTTTISAGALALGSNGALGSTSSITLSGSGVGYFSIVGLTGPVVNPTATLTLNGTSYFQAQGDALTVASLSGVSGSQLTIGDYVITGTGGGTYAGPFTVGNGTSTTYAGLITGTAASGTLLTKVGSGTLTLSGANIYTGPTAINGGILQVARAETAGTSGPLGKSGTIGFGGGTLQYSSANQFDYSSRFSTAASQAYSIDTNGQAVTYATALTSSGGTLTKLGTGTLTLTGNSTYSGATTIIGGTLLAASTTGAALGGTTQVNVNNSGTLQLGASNQINAAASVALGGGTGTGSATFNAGGFSQGTVAAPGVGALTLNATAAIDFGAGNTGNVLHFANSGTTTWTNGTTLFINNYTGSVIQQNGSTVAGATTDALLFGMDATGLNTTQITQVEFVNPSGYNGTFGASIDSAGMVFADVPEPATFFAGASLLGALGWHQRRRVRGLFAGRRMLAAA